MQIGLSSLFSATFVMVGPLMFMKFLRDIEFKTIYSYVQIMFIVQVVVTFFYATRLNIQLGMGTESDTFFYFLGNLLIGFDTILNLLPAFIIMAQIANPGIEATMV